MRAVKDLEIGVMFWSTDDPAKDIETVLGFGVRAGQLGISGELELATIEGSWRATLAQHPEFAVATAVCAYSGEDYTDVASVHETVGFTPPGTRRERIERTKAVADFAGRLGIGSIACHIGFIPEEPSDPVYQELVEGVRDICDSAAKHGQTFALETGQERADVLLGFLRDARRPNLKINFDPANMILYGMGDPVEALRALAAHVVSVHCKDGVPPKQPGQLGTETRLGTGQVDFPAFLKTLKDSGYRGILSIERETPDPAVRTADVQHAVHFLQSLLI